MSAIPDSDPLVGQLVAGKYRVLGRLGRGGMGTVYRIEHVMMKKEMALKVLLPGLGRSDELVRRFEREAEAAARLSHPNIITVTDFGRTVDGQLYLVMELLEGPSLAEVIGVDDERRPVAVVRAVHIVRQILRALEHAHRAGVVHRDLKPDNIVLVEREGVPDVVKLLDFGIAKLSIGEGAADEALTQAGMIYGTPEYLSPEQALGEPADARADLYSTGVILYELLCGRRPFEAESKLALVSMHITAAAMPVVRRAPDAAIPVELSDVVERAMQKRREDRYQTAASFLDALDAQGGASRRGRATTLMGRVRRTLIGSLVPIERYLSARGVPRAALLARVLACTVAMLLGLAALAVVRKAPAKLAGSATSDAAEVDLSRFERQLKTGRACKDRKAAALELIAAGDRRYLGALEAARDRRGGFLGLERTNACMQKELEAGIRKFGGAL